MFQLLKISLQLFLVFNLVMLWILKLWLLVARFKGNVLATLHRSCMQTEQRPLRGALMRQGCWYPSFLLFFFLSLYHRKWGTCHWLFLVPDILNSLGSDHIWHSWDVYTQGEVENNQNTLNISFWIHTPPDISNSAVEKRKQYWYINHVTVVICWLHSRERDKVFFYRLLFVEFEGAVCHSYQQRVFWSNRWAVSWSSSRKTSCATGSLAPFLFLSGL